MIQLSFIQIWNFEELQWNIIVSSHKKIQYPPSTSRSWIMPIVVRETSSLTNSPLGCAEILILTLNRQLRFYFKRAIVELFIGLIILRVGWAFLLISTDRVDAAFCSLAIASLINSDNLEICSIFILPPSHSTLDRGRSVPAIVGLRNSCIAPTRFAIYRVCCGLAGVDSCTLVLGGTSCWENSDPSI